jgi:hypothetical protein
MSWQVLEIKTTRTRKGFRIFLGRGENFHAQQFNKFCFPPRTKSKSTYFLPAHKLSRDKMAMAHRKTSSLGLAGVFTGAFWAIYIRSNVPYKLPKLQLEQTKL